PFGSVNWVYWTSSFGGAATTAACCAVAGTTAPINAMVRTKRFMSRFYLQPERPLGEVLCDLYPSCDEMGRRWLRRFLSLASSWAASRIGKRCVTLTRC